MRGIGRASCFKSELLKTMLRTYEGNEATPLSLVLGSNVRMWHSVSFEFPTPYFLICHALKNGSTWKIDTCLLWGQSNVLDFCNLVNADPDRKIIQFSILLPSENAQNWHMEELEEIWSHPKAGKFRPLVFVGLEGKILGGVPQREKFVSLDKPELLYFRQL